MRTSDVVDVADVPLMRTSDSDVEGEFKFEIASEAIWIFAAEIQHVDRSISFNLRHCCHSMTQ